MRIICRVIKCCVDICHHEHIRNEENKSQSSVQDIAPSHGTGDSGASIFNLFRHVYCRIKADTTINGRYLANHKTQTREFHPPSLVNWVKVTLAVFRGASAHNTMMMAKKPKT